jgi:transcriptional regulator with PAS, ATPase and Fis domain
MKNEGAGWFDEVAFPVTVCDKTGIIVYMNQASIDEFEPDGGKELLGKSLLDCHPEPARAKLTEMLAKQIPNTYISSSAGKQYFVHETPWFEDGEYKGFVEISIEITNLEITK